jgi:hypothetical protein
MIRRFAAAQQYDDPAAARYPWMGPDVSPRPRQPPQPQDTVPLVAEARDQDLMLLLAQQIAEAEQDAMMQLLAAGAPQRDILAAAAKVAREQDIMAQVATAELSREQEMIVRQARQPEMTMLLQAAAAHQDPMARYSKTELDISLGQGHPYRHQPTVQQLADVERVAREPNTTTMQQVAAYMNGEHVSDSGVTAAFQLPGSAEAAPFRVQQQPPPQGQTPSALGLEVDSSLPPLPPSLGGPHPHGQVSQQQGTDGGDEDQSSDLSVYLFD